SRSPDAQTLLDAACGSGRHLESFAMHFKVEGLDVNGDLLTLARQRLPTVPLHQADMTDFELPTRFDVITCLFSSIRYLRSLSKVRTAVQRMAQHLNHAGVMIIEPWFMPDRYWTDTITANFVNEHQLKIAWMYTSKRVENVSVLEIHYMVGMPDGVEEFTETHEIGLFTQEEYLDAMAAAGLRCEFYSETTFGRGLYIGQWR